ncbi:DeoR/GlpR family DNA-binding transcription regulator [Metabacillus bambusae]|uniref:DeoR/GlpR transcriptional regulator n=1 Tax=Metabacillus bambusae TaxID=2795218 RepID=A0ABS3N2Y1_9BACI|nr:DeoR/GlpR family DNA-binding transcription regulator [Metabacillus bambusae]MBO1512583.1 DeoR/GlpR transcriptional regulator [Metabacillus bambusae]
MSLLAEERKKIIMDLLEENEQVKVADLAIQFHVSTETIRRDLEELESENKLKKVYGGAVKISRENEEPSLFEREILRVEEKKRIARKALEFIEDGDVIVIDEGTTTYQMVNGLCDKKGITVITNSFPVSSLLISHANKQMFDGELIFIGGKVQFDHYRSSSSLSEKIAKEFFPDKVFISADGLIPDKGVMSYDIEKTQLSKIYLENATKSFLLLDHSKIGIKASYRLASLKDIDYIMSDVPIPKDWKNEEIDRNKWISCK